MELFVYYKKHPNGHEVVSHFGFDLHFPRISLGFPGGSVVSNLPANAGDMGSFPGSGRSSREGNGNPLQYSCLEHPIDKGAWWATDHGVAKELDIT